MGCGKPVVHTEVTTQICLLKVWQVVGRGFQAVLALIAYKVTTKSLMMSMEQVSVPIETFEAVTLQDSSFVAFYKQLHSFLAVRGWRHQLRIAWIILSTLFIVAFPTLASAMTGYAPLTDAFLRAQDELLIPFTSYRQIHYIVHDADRIGLDKPLVLTNVPGDSIGTWQLGSSYPDVSRTLLTCSNSHRRHGYHKRRYLCLRPQHPSPSHSSRTCTRLEC